jgi:electron transfer flavoprotein alpha subunit
VVWTDRLGAVVWDYAGEMVGSAGRYLSGVVGSPTTPESLSLLAIRRKPGECRQAEVVRVEPRINAEAARSRVVRLIKADPRTVDLVEADIIVAGGRGVGGPEKWHVVEELTAALRGSVGGSRVAMDVGCIPRQRMVGVSGRRINPKLYVVVGISGASYHAGGIQAAIKIVAIYRDRPAPIFKLANMGVVGDPHQVLPALSERLHQLTERVSDGGSPAS